jgi:hypothetical protein
MIWKKLYHTICHKLKKNFSKKYEIEEVDWDGDTWIEDEVMGYDPDNLTFKSIWEDIRFWFLKKN